MNKKLKSKARTLVACLRHDPKGLNGELEYNGAWMNVDIVLSSLKITLEQLKLIVDNDSKGRLGFEQNEDKPFSKIRANYGHGNHIDVDLGFKVIIPKNKVYHGTSSLFLDSILKTGLLKMKRQFVNLSQETVTAREVAKRHGGEVVLFEIKVQEMLKDNYVFFVSENELMFIEHIPPQYLIRIN